MSFRATNHVIPSGQPCHSERSEESPPSQNVRGIGGCPHVIPTHLSRHSRGAYPMSFRATNHVIPSAARNLPPSLNLPPSNVRGLGGCSASCWLPPHLTVHPPFAKRKGDRGMPTRPTHSDAPFTSFPRCLPPCHSERPTMSFRAQRGISPFAKRKGDRGMPIMPIMIQHPLHPSHRL